MRGVSQICILSLPSESSVGLRGRSQATVPVAPGAQASCPSRACHPSSANSNKMARVPGSWNGEERNTEPILRTSGTWIKLDTQRRRAPCSGRVRDRVLQMAEAPQHQAGDQWDQAGEQRTTWGLIPAGTLTVPSSLCKRLWYSLQIHI